MPQAFVRIANRNTYTNLVRAIAYVRRGLAREHFVGLNRRLLEIWMLDEAELEIVKSERRAERARMEIYASTAETTGYAWYVAESGGSAILRDCAGISGGTRLWNAKGGYASAGTVSKAL